MLQATAAGDLGIDPPFAIKLRQLRCLGQRRRTQILGHIETDAAGADDGDTLACRLRTRQQLDVAHTFTVFDARDRGKARRDTSGDHDFIETRVCKHGRIWRATEPQADAEFGDARAKITQCLVEFFLARHIACEIELPTDPLFRFKQCDLMPALGSRHGAGKAGWAGADHGDPLQACWRWLIEIELAAGLGIDETSRCALGKDKIEASLVAGNADVDLIAAAVAGLVGEFGIS